MLKTEVAIVLVAGRGERLRPLTDDRPKALVDVGGETLLGRTVRLLAAYGVSEIVLATGYREDAVKSAMERAPAKVTYVRNDAWDRTQNSVSMCLCEPAIAGRAFFKLDGDLLFRHDVLDRLDAVDAGIATAVDYRANLGAEEMKVTTDGARITAFGKHLDPKLSAGESIGLERLGAAVGSRVFEALRAAGAAGRTNLYYEDVYAELVATGERATAVDVSDLPWCEIDTPEDLASARSKVASKLLG